MVSSASMPSPTAMSQKLHCAPCVFLVCALCLAVASATGSVVRIAAAASLQAPTSIPVQASSDQALWRVDLHSVGYPLGDSQLQSRRALEEFNTIDFFGDGVVAATFVTQQSVPGAQRRDDPNRVRPYMLHAIFLDTLSGKVLNTIEWPADDPNVGIFPRYGGGFLFFSTEHIVLYSAEGKTIKERPLPQLQAVNAGHIGIAESPSGKTLVIRFQQADATICIHIDTETLDDSEGPCSISRLFSISDSGMAARSDKLYDRPESSPVQPEVVGEVEKSQLDLFGSIQIQEHGKSARKLCDTSGLAGCKVPQFLNNETIVVFDWYTLGMIGDPETVPTQQPKVQMKLAHHEWIDIVGRPVRASSNGHRFVVAINLPPTDLKGKKAAIHAFLGDVPAAYPSHVDVFDLPLGQWIYSLNTKKNGASTHEFQQIWGLALSPSGNKLVIDSGGIVQAYALPPSTKSSSPNQ
jgi:hypothetical protein